MNWMDVAWTQQGIAETAGAGATPEIVAYFRDAGHASQTSDEVPWCAAFVCACLERSGIRSPRTLRARDFEGFGSLISLDAPRVGAIAVFKRGSDPSAGHVAFVTGWTPTTLACLGGNQDDKVGVAHFPRESLVALRWPEPPASVQDLAKAGSRTVTAAIGQVKDAGKAAAMLVSGAAATVATPDKPLAPPKISGHVTSFMSDAQTLERFAVFALAKWPWIAGAMALWWLGSMAVKAGWIAEARVEDHNTGANTARAGGKQEAANVGAA